MRVAILGGETSERDLLEKYLGEWAGQKKHCIEALKFESVESFLVSWEEDKKYDLLLLDIEMQEINGLELAEKIHMDDGRIPVAFVKGYDENMRYSFGVLALHYLIKPVDKTNLFILLDKLHERKKGTDDILITTEDGQRSVMVGKIMFVEAFGYRSILHLTDKRICIKESMGAVEKLLKGKSNFVKCHRAYIVNLLYISEVQKKEIIMDSNEIVLVSRYHLKDVQEAFNRKYGINQEE
ncbi:MAG: LytTR family DNA-binding domain-containing protein [Bacillota bacterium]|nr:LytTR family DNA-binding domain-containing protein [Bacillota bacterium]